MADLSIGVVVNLNPIQKTVGVAGTTIAAGKSVYFSSATGQWLLAQGTLAAIAYGTPLGIALTAGVANGTFTIATSGDVSLGVTVVLGTIYVVSAAAAGGIAPDSDISTGNYVNILGVGYSAEIIRMSPFASGVASA